MKNIQNNFDFKVYDKKKKSWIDKKEIARLHFNDGVCYGIMTWDERMLLGDDFSLEVFPIIKTLIRKSKRNKE
jgi:hypothetical protein